MINHPSDTAEHRKLLQFVERFALVLSDSGMQRMAARVFAYLLAHDSGRLTAAQLASGLNVSPAAISGAVRVLIHSGLVLRDREPGARSDHFRLHDDTWVQYFEQREPQFRTWESIVQEGAELIGYDRPGGRRLEESRAFFAFFREEFPVLVEKWRRRRRELGLAPSHDEPSAETPFRNGTKAVERNTPAK